VSTFVLVPGACHGGWWYEPLVAELEAAGHQGIAVTPSGLGPAGLAGKGHVNLSSHIGEVTRVTRSCPRTVTRAGP